MIHFLRPGHILNCCCIAVIDKEKFEVPEDHVVVGDHPITAEFSDAALIPAKFCLKTLTLDLLKKR